MPPHVKAIGVFVDVGVLAKVIGFTEANRTSPRLAPSFSAGMSRIRLLYNPRDAAKYMENAKVREKRDKHMRTPFFPTLNLNADNNQRTTR